MLSLNALNKFAPVRKKFLHANHCRLVNTTLSKALMHGAKLHHKFLKEITAHARLAYNKQRNICVTIFCKSKKTLFESLGINNAGDNRKLWGTVKSLFLNKVKSNVHKTLIENDQLIRNEYKMANIFNNFFINVVPNLVIYVDQ